MTPVTRADQVSLEHGLGTLVASCEKGEGDKMGSGSCCFGPKFVLAAAIAVGLILMLAQTTQARAQAREEAGIVTIQAVEPKTPTLGQPLTFAVVVENNSVAQRVGVEDFLPPEASLVSAKPSQGTCDIRRDGARGRESVGCDLGVVQRGGHGQGRNRRDPRGCWGHNEYGG